MEELTSSDIEYQFTIEAYVKMFKGQRMQTSEHLSDFIAKCTGVDDFKIKLWNQYEKHIKGKAVIPTNTDEKCSIEGDSKSIENIQKFLVFQRSNRSIYLSNTFTSRTLQTFSTPGDSGEAKIELVVYTYSDSILSSAAWDRFTKDCIQPAVADRAGASSEEVIQQIMNSLKSRWQHIFHSEDINWRIWATIIARLKSHDQEQAIQSPPTENLVHLFAHAPENREQRYAAVTRGFGLAFRSIDSAIQELQIFDDDIEKFGDQIRALIESHNTMTSRLNSIFKILKTQRDLAREAEAAMIAEETPIASAVAAAIPNQDDIDHMDI